MGGCVSPREQEDVDIQSKEIQLQIFLCSIDDIRNGFFYLNEGENITQQHLLSGFQNMQNIVLALITKYTGADELLKKFMIPFKQPDGSYEFRNILICFFLNSREKSSDKAKAIANLLFQDKEELTRYEIRNIFQRIFRCVLSYSLSLVDKYLVPKPKPVEEENKAEQEQDKQNQIDDEKQQEIEQKNRENNEQIEQQEQQMDENKEQQNQQNEDQQKKEENQEVKKISIEDLEREKEARKQARRLKKKIIEKVVSEEVEAFLKYGKKMANKITKKFLSTPDETMSVDDFAEKCETLIPDKFGKDIMWPRGVRLLAFELHDKSTFKR